MRKFSLMFCPFIVLCLLFAGSVFALSTKEREAAESLALKNRKLDAMKARLEESRDSLQVEIAARWQAKQRFVQQRETDKEAIDQLREKLERAYSELSQVKEEEFAKAQVLEEEKKDFAQKKEDWSYVGSTQSDLYQKQADDLKECMPLDMEGSRAALENIRRKFKGSGSSYTAFLQFLGYKRVFIRNGSHISFEKRTVLTDNSGTQLLTLVRFGNTFAYGMNDKSEFYFVNQTGRLGEARYSIDKVESLKFLTFLKSEFPRWIETKTVSGGVMLDIMQNTQSKVLLAGTKISSWQTFYLQLKSGGAIMIPLLLLPLWALALILIKVIQFGSKKRRQKNVLRKVTVFLDNNDSDGARAYLEKRNLALARIFGQFLANPAWSRPSAEKAAQEIFIEEMPKLNTHLNTLAVMAGAAPLLGLLGTISGMINLFGAVTYHGTGDPKFLAGGISEALITAKTGLAIAIPLLFIHDYLRNKKDQIQAHIETCTVQILNRLWPKE
jgi:biopolymer transport protein ExbB